MSVRDKVLATLSAATVVAILLPLLVGCACPTEAPETEAPSTEAPSTEAPPTEAPPTEAPPTEAPPEPEAELTDATMVLIWVISGQFSGYLVAKDKGFYEEEGINLEIVPGGPEVQPASLVAAGKAEFGTANQAIVILGRSQGIPLVGIMQEQQIPGLRIICKKSTGIEAWEDLGDRKVGVWFGGGEFEPYYAVTKAGLEVDDVEWLPQKFSMVEFYEDKFDCASAMVWNELHTVLDAGYSREDLTILSAADLDVFLPAGGAFTREDLITENPELVQGFVSASLRGYQYALQHPEEAAEIVLKFSPDLDYHKQFLQVEEVNRLVVGADAAEMGIGYLPDMSELHQMLQDTGQLDAPIDLDQAFTNRFWEAAPEEYKAIDDLAAILARIEENTY